VQDDRLDIEVYMKESSMPQMVLAVAPKKVMKTMLKEDGGEDGECLRHHPHPQTSFRWTWSRSILFWGARSHAGTVLVMPGDADRLPPALSSRV